jgi:hypothetical protein
MMTSKNRGHRRGREEFEEDGFGEDGLAPLDNETLTLMEMLESDCKLLGCICAYVKNYTLSRNPHCSEANIRDDHVRSVKGELAFKSNRALFEMLALSVPEFQSTVKFFDSCSRAHTGYVKSLLVELEVDQPKIAEYDAELDSFQNQVTQLTLAREAATNH